MPWRRVTPEERERRLEMIAESNQCPASRADPENVARSGVFYCIKDRGHEGDHEDHGGFRWT